MPAPAATAEQVVCCSGCFECARCFCPRAYDPVGELVFTIALSPFLIAAAAFAAAGAVVVAPCLLCFLVAACCSPHLKSSEV